VDTSDADAAGGYYVIRYEAPYEDIVVEAHVMDNTGALDRYGLVMELADEVYDMRISGPIITGLCAVAFIIIIIYLLCAAGHNGRDGEIHKNFLDKVPFDVHTLAVCAVICVCIAVGCEAVMSSVMYLVMWCVLASVIYFVLLSYVMSFATRLKAGGIIKGTLIYRGCRLLRKQLKRAGTFAKHVLMSIPGVWQAAIVICAIAVYELIMISLYYDGYRYLMWVIEYIIVIPLAIMAAVALRRIRNGAKELAGGNIEYQIDTKYIPGCLKNFSADMNSISDGLTSAVEDRMKSERFKTELITNVSHDIKTPLTSIINYVDLIKKEKPENENIRQYIDVLDRQSSRLKKLIEDLVEASKASTGNVSVSMEPCEVGVIVAQTAGEYDEKLKSRQLDLVMNIPEEPCRIMADGRHLWRVLDNLMNNIYKYAQPGTRVYINLERKNGRVSIIFKNISKYELNISSDELLERFTRGDVSRNTEGSGLGLSIANSLTELQGGTLSLTVDGDLFKVILTFDEI
jgi:signal transduction histidine kinase